MAQVIQFDLSHTQGRPVSQDRPPQGKSSIKSIYVLPPPLEEDEAQHYFELGQACERDPKRKRLAAGMYNRCLEANPDHAQANNALGWIRFEQGKRAKNIRWRLVRHQEAEACFRAAIEIEPDSWQAYYNLGQLYQWQKLIGRAQTQYGWALQRNFEAPEVHLSLAILLTERKRYQQAIRHFNKHIELDPGGVGSVYARREIQKLSDKTLQVV